MKNTDSNVFTFWIDKNDQLHALVNFDSGILLANSFVRLCESKTEVVSGQVTAAILFAAAKVLARDGRPDLSVEIFKLLKQEQPS